MQIQDVTLDHPDGPMRIYEARPDGDAGPGGGARGAVIVVQEAFGVNDHIEDVTRRFADAGYHAVAPELFHRTGGGTVPYDDFSQVLSKFEGLDDDALLRDIDAAIDHLHAAGWVDAQIGIVGFCMGGRVSMLVSLRRPLGAGVGFYGGGIVKGRFPQFPALIDEVPSLTVPWLGLFGDLDGGIPVNDVERLRTVLDQLDTDTEIVRYADADHGFHCDARPAYDEAAALDGWARTLAWFDAHLAR
ncbi:MAG: dienelactone hydrolase family protein [Acidimicrobiales bacterium]